MTLNIIWRSSYQIKSVYVVILTYNISLIIYDTSAPEKEKLLIRNHTTAVRWYDLRWHWRYSKVIRLFHTTFLVNSAWYGKSYYGLLIEKIALTSFRLVQDIWRLFRVVSCFALLLPYVYGLFICLENGNNLSDYKVVFSMNIVSTFHSDDSWFVNEIHAAMTKFRLIIRLI